MSKNEEAAPVVAAAESGKGKSLEAASIPVSDCNIVSEDLQDKLIGTVEPGICIRQSDQARMFLCLKRYGFTDKDFFRVEQNGFTIAQVFLACYDQIKRGQYKPETMRSEFFEDLPELLIKGNSQPAKPILRRRTYSYLNGRAVHEVDLDEMREWLYEHGFSDNDLHLCWNWNLDHIAVFGKVLTGLIDGWFKEDTARDDFFARFSFLLEVPTYEKLKSFMEERRQEWKRFVMNWNG